MSDVIATLCLAVAELENRLQVAEAERDATIARAERAEAALGRVLDWTHEHGVAICPPAGSFDTFGEGMRKAKCQVSSIANASGAPLLAELARLRVVRDAAESLWIAHRWTLDQYGSALRKALDDAKAGS